MRTPQISAKETPSSAASMRRRDFIRLAAGAAVTCGAWKPLEALAVPKLESLPPGIKISLQISTDATAKAHLRIGSPFALTNVSRRKNNGELICKRA